MQKPKIFLKCGCKVGAGLWLCLPDVWRVCWCGCARPLCYFADVSKIVLMLPLFGVFPAFPDSTLGAFPLNMALFRVLRAFLEGFGVRMYVYMGLVLCVACVAFVRVWS